MLDKKTMWLPGFEPEPVVILPASVGPQKPIAIEVREYVEEKTRQVWPAAPAGLWNRAFTPVERFKMNVEAVKAAQALAVGEKPTADVRDTLNLFTGWGALQEAFGHTSAWAARKSELAEILKEGLDAARTAVTTSFFTPPEIISAIWRGIERLGFKGGKVLEPSAGSGMFLACMPEDIAKRSQVTAIELDQSTAAVLGALYAPYGVKVLNTGFEKASLPANFFDVVVSNVPFGTFGVPDTRAVPFRDFLIHDYFIARALEVVRPGGLVVALTSAGTMDKARAGVREYINSQAKLVTAFRLPNNAFKAFAGTEPTTDILVFQKYRENELAGSQADSGWMESNQLPNGHRAFCGKALPFGKKIAINDWFASHPENILGEMGITASGGYTSESACLSDGTDYVARLNEGMDRLPERVYVRSVARKERGAIQRVTVANDTGLPAGSFVLIDGKVCVSEGAELVVMEESLSAKAKDRIRGMIAVRDVMRALIDSQVASADDTVPEQLRGELLASYDNFVKGFGPITSVANMRAFNGDPAAALLASLENVQEDSSIKKAEIFFRRTVGAVIRVEHCDTTEAALLASLGEKGLVDLDLMAELTGMTPEDVADDLSCKGAIYRNPSNHAWEPADEYLSGDVKTKLSMAEMSGSDFANNVAALTEIIPKDLTPNDINARLGSTWVPLADYEAFYREVFEIRPGQSVRVSYEAISGSWSAKTDQHSLSVAASQAFGTDRVDARELFEQALNLQAPTITDADPHDSKKRVINQKQTIAAREKQQAIKDRFVTWLWEDEQRAARLAGCYNDTFNRTVERKYNGQHLVLPGFSTVYKLHVHQRDAIWRVVSSKRNTLLAHCVGAGKTLEMICSGMELKRLGIATKPCYVVPNHMLGQFSSDFYKAYPSANVLVASKDDLAGPKRRDFLSRIAVNNWDAVVITHASFERIKMSEKTIGQFIDDQLAQIETAILIEQGKGNKATVRQLERTKREWAARLEKNATSKRDEGLDLSFEDLGIDWVFLDEAQVVKNLYRFSKMSRVAGLPTANSERAFDMFLKTRWLSRLHSHHGGVVFATGTPVSNSVAEMYVMQRFLQPKTLESRGIEMFDPWAANFGESVTAIEISPDGSGYRMNTRFARFTNLPELMAMYREVADIRTADMVNLPVPACMREMVSAKPSPELVAYVEQLVSRSEKVKNGSVHPKEDNMLAITGDGRRAALDLRLVDPAAIDDPQGKVNLCVGQVAQIYKDTAAERLTQVVFCDMGTPGSAGSFSVYGDIKGKLIRAGLKPHEIAFAHDANTDAAKEVLARDVRSGKVRVILGSTQKLGVGTNMQDRLVALHHLDAPWRPSDVEQREGRIIRQGNQNESVQIIRYVTEKSFDAYIWQTLETKARFIAQIMSGDTAVRTAEDLELAALSYAEVKALASGNPVVLEKAGVDAEVAKLTIMKTQYDQQQWSNRRELADLPSRILAMERRHTAVTADVVMRDAMGPFALESGGHVITDPALAGQAIAKAVQDNMWRGSKEIVLGKVGGFTVTAEAPMGVTQYRLRLRGNSVHEEYFSGKAVTAGRVLQGMLAEMGTIASNLAHQVESMKAREDGLRAQVNVPFDKADRLAEMLIRQADVNAKLGIADGVLMEAEAA